MLADTFKGFLEPVAEAFGEHDGAEKLGMMRRSELEYIAQQGLRRVSTELTDVSRRSDVRSPAATAHTFYWVKMWRTVDWAVKRGYTSVAWPVWGAHLQASKRAALKHAVRPQASLAPTSCTHAGHETCG